MRVNDTGRCEVSVQHAGSLGVIGWSVLLAVAGIVGGWGRQLGRYIYPFLMQLRSWRFWFRQDSSR